MTFLQVLWFILIFVLVSGYFALDGFDLGAGVMEPFLAKTPTERALVKRAIGPVWDGNEVWLLTGGGALFAAFAPAYATTFSGFYLAIMLVLFGLIVRAVSIELGAHDPKFASLWDKLFVVGSFLPALLFGVAIGNVLEGIQLNAAGDYTGGFFALLNPFALVCGLVGLCAMCAQGCAWVAVKCEGSLQQRAVALRPKMQLVTLALFILATLLWFFAAKPATDQGLVILGTVFALLFVGCMLLAWVQGNKQADLVSFLYGALACVMLVALTGASLFPYIVPATDPTLSITVAAAAGSELTLTVMTIVAVIGVPLVLFYHYLVYKRFAGKVTEADLH